MSERASNLIRTLSYLRSLAWELQILIWRSFKALLSAYRAHLLAAQQVGSREQMFSRARARTSRRRPNKSANYTCRAQPPAEHFLNTLLPFACAAHTERARKARARRLRQPAPQTAHDDDDDDYDEQRCNKQRAAHLSAASIARKARARSRAHAHNLAALKSRRTQDRKQPPLNRCNLSP